MEERSRRSGLTQTQEVSQRVEDVVSLPIALVDVGHARQHSRHGGDVEQRLEVLHDALQRRARYVLVAFLPTYTPHTDFFLRLLLLLFYTINKQWEEIELKQLTRHIEQAHLTENSRRSSSA